MFYFNCQLEKEVKRHRSTVHFDQQCDKNSDVKIAALNNKIKADQGSKIGIKTRDKEKQKMVQK